MDTDRANQEEELKIKTRAKQAKPVTKLLCGRIPADLKDLGLQVHAHDPKKYINFDKLMIGKGFKTGNLKFTFTNRNFINWGEKIKHHFEARSIEVNRSMIIGRHKLKGSRNEYSKTLQPSPNS